MSEKQERQRHILDVITSRAVGTQRALSEALSAAGISTTQSTGGAGHTLVLKTMTGHAQGVCEAIDRAGWAEVVGTIAGENTIFILCQSVEERELLKERILEISQ